MKKIIKMVTGLIMMASFFVGYANANAGAAATKYTTVNYKGKVTANTLNVRSGMGTKYKVVGKLSNGKTVQVTRKSNQWVYITSGKTKGWAMVKYVKKVTTTSTTSTTTSTTSTISATEKKVVDLTNVERKKAGLKPFAIDNQVSKVARIKSQDMTNKNYFDHNSPTYGSPFDMMKQFGISYKYAAENIAKGQKTPEEVVKAWMNSSGHRANIMNGNLTHIGVGYDSRTNSWTQMFISK